MRKNLHRLGPWKVYVSAFQLVMTSVDFINI
jgi:hypothetical protein